VVQRAPVAGAGAATAADEPKPQTAIPAQVSRSFFCLLPWRSPIQTQMVIWTSIQQLSALALTLRGSRSCPSLWVLCTTGVLTAAAESMRRSNRYKY
jgi:hypothetical protein